MTKKLRLSNIQRQWVPQFLALAAATMVIVACGASPSTPDGGMEFQTIDVSVMAAIANTEEANDAARRESEKLMTALRTAVAHLTDGNIDVDEQLALLDSLSVFRDRLLGADEYTSRSLAHTLDISMLRFAVLGFVVFAPDLDGGQIDRLVGHVVDVASLDAGKTSQCLRRLDEGFKSDTLDGYELFREFLEYKGCLKPGQSVFEVMLDGGQRLGRRDTAGYLESLDGEHMEVVAGSIIGIMSRESGAVALLAGIENEELADTATFSGNDASAIPAARSELQYRLAPQKQILEEYLQMLPTYDRESFAQTLKAELNSQVRKWSGEGRSNSF